MAWLKLLIELFVLPEYPVLVMHWTSFVLLQFPANKTLHFHTLYYALYIHPEPDMNWAEEFTMVLVHEHGFQKITYVLVLLTFHYHMGLDATKPVFRVSNKATIKPLSSAIETS